MAKREAQRTPIYYEISTQKELADLLGCSAKTITDYSREGLMVKAPGRGRYFTHQSVQNVLTKLRDASRGQRNTTTSYQKERTKTEIVKRKREEILLEQTRGSILTLEEVTENWTDFGRIIKTRILSLPSRLRMVIPHLTDHDSKVMRDEVFELLREMADEVDDSVIAADPEAISGE